MIANGKVSECMGGFQGAEHYVLIEVRSPAANIRKLLCVCMGQIVDFYREVSWRQEERRGERRVEGFLQCHDPVG